MEYHILCMNDSEDTSYIILPESWVLWLTQDKAEWDLIPDTLQTAHYTGYNSAIEFNDVQSWDQVLTILAECSEYYSEAKHLSNLAEVIEWWDEVGYMDPHKELIEIHGVYY